MKNSMIADSVSSTPEVRARVGFARVRGAAVCALLLTLVAVPVHGQQSASRPVSTQAPGRVSLTVRSGAWFPSASGGVFEVAKRDLTLGSGDLRSPNLGAEIGFFMAPRLQLHVAVDRSLTTADSQTREAPPAGGGEVSQQTEFGIRSAVSAGLRAYLVAPRADGPYASKTALFVSAGAGLARYRFEQSGAFLDADRQAVFEGSYASQGRGSMLFAGLGGHYALSKRIALVAEGRYENADAPLAGRLAAFDRINLSGARLILGVQLRW